MQSIERKKFVNKYKKTSIILTILSALVLSTSTANAQEVKQNQDLDQEFKVVCTVGSYGQNTECTVEGSQSGSQSQSIKTGNNFVTLPNGTSVRIHTPVDTGLETQTKIAMMGIIAIGGISLLTKKQLVK